MAFDELARHMASRDGQPVVAPTSADDFIRRAAEDNRRIDRRNNLILGTILLVGGLIMAGFFIVMLLDPAYRRGILDGDAGPITARITGMFAVCSAIIIGAQRVWRGLRG